MMNQNSKEGFVKALQRRTKLLAIRIIKYCKFLPKTQESRIIIDQIIRSGSSVGSNYRAACRARSSKEFYAKLCIVVEEADETLFWLEVIKESGISRGEETNLLINEATEILSIMATSRKTAGKNLK